MKGHHSAGRDHHSFARFHIASLTSALTSNCKFAKAGDGDRLTFLKGGLVPGQWYGQPMTPNGVRAQWADIRTALHMDGLWAYDLRRTIACYLSNELHADDKTIQAILNHYDGRALSHYVHKTFDSLTGVIQGYADWLLALKGKDSHNL